MISMSEMEMLPVEMSSMRRSVLTREDFPLPLRPQMPSFAPGGMVREILLRVEGAGGLEGQE